MNITFLFLSVFSLLLVILEGSVSSLPWLVVWFLCLLIVRKSPWVLGLAFVCGMLLDIFLLRPVGETSLFLSVSLFLVWLYDRKYEIDSLPFVVFSSFGISFAYLLLFGAKQVLLQAGMSCVIGVVFYLILHFVFVQEHRRRASYGL
jgi:hypothetical protein